MEMYKEVLNQISIAYGLELMIHIYYEDKNWYNK